MDTARRGGLEHVLGALGELGVSFGACHTEYVDAGQGPALIEVNDRMIGDDCNFVLSDLLGVDLFDLVLRVYLGEPLPRAGTAVGGHRARGHRLHRRRPFWRARRLAPRGRAAEGEPGVLLSFRPLRKAGDHIVITHTNRDYPG